MTIILVHGAGTAYLCNESPAMRRCYELLVKTSRSFPELVKDMSQDTRNVICLANLCIRALDTIEDDMSLEDDVRKPLLRTLYQKLDDPSWTFNGSTDKDKIVLEEFTVVTQALQEISPEAREIIKETLKIMGEGMASHKVTEVETFERLNEYSHWSSGVIIQQMEKLYCQLGVEDPMDNQLMSLSDTFGIFFQKVDNIKDYVEDLLEGRQLWPTEVWSSYTENLGDFAQTPSVSGCYCINHLTLDCLKMLPDCIKYVCRHRDYGHFRFTALRLCLLVSSLEQCFNNPAVFYTSKIKARKGEILKILHFVTSQDKFKAVLSHLLERIRGRIPTEDPYAEDLRKECSSIVSICRSKVSFGTYTIAPLLYVTSVSLMAVMTFTLTRSFL